MYARSHYVDVALNLHEFSAGTSTRNIDFLPVCVSFFHFCSGLSSLSSSSSSPSLLLLSFSPTPLFFPRLPPHLLSTPHAHSARFRGALTISLSHLVTLSLAACVLNYRKTRLRTIELLTSSYHMQ